MKCLIIGMTSICIYRAISNNVQKISGRTAWTILIGGPSYEMFRYRPSWRSSRPLKVGTNIKIVQTFYPEIFCAPFGITLYLNGNHSWPWLTLKKYIVKKVNLICSSS